MSVVLGSGEHRYRVVENWAKLPDGWEFRDVAAVAVDSKDRIYVFNRGQHPMMVFDRDGNFLRSWGEGLFSRAHGIHIDSDDEDMEDLDSEMIAWLQKQKAERLADK